MKKIILFALLVLPLFALAQGNTKSQIKVSGNCGMCKTRIENAAKVPGVTSATWSQETKMLSLEYNERRVKLDDIHKRIADAGHDTEKAKATDQAYDKLPGCCKYDRKTAEAPKTGGSCCSR
jgi:periplasmic mercuric ion binding protein